MEMESILMSIKKMLGPAAEHEHFDTDIIIHINSVFMDLKDFGIGPSDGFEIEDETTLWTDYIPNVKLLSAVKSYMYLRVRLLFDPPQSSAVIDTMQRDIDKWEWRLTNNAEFIET